MNWWDALILGIVQGLTEFLPISSKGHLALFQTMIPGFNQPGVLFDVWLHAATLCAVILYFRRDLIAIARSFWPGGSTGGLAGWTAPEARWFVVLIVVATIPVGVLGIAFRKEIERTFQSVLLIGLALLINGLILFLAARFRKGEKRIGNFRLWDALWVGLAQIAALFPGISRSGSTISAGMFRGLRGEEAIKFSFFLSLPVILGAVLLEGLKEITRLHPEDLPAYGIGFIASLASGLLAISLILRIVRNNGLQWFAYYCWLVGIMVVLAKLSGWL